MDPSGPNVPIEYDENGIPYFKWPPFPVPLPGVSIVPFKDFKPTGIQMQMMDDEVEVDGEGIPTVQLNVKHDGEQRPKKKQRRKKSPAAEEHVNWNEWWNEWAAGEDLRSNYNYDDMLPMADRLEAAAEDFKKSRKWPPLSLQIEFWWNRFQLFAGVIGRETRPIYKKFEDEDPAVEEGGSDSEGAAGPTTYTGLNASPQPVTIQEFDPDHHRIVNESLFAETDEEFNARRVRDLEEREKCLDRFLSNPERSVKIFFSSYFRDKGMMWQIAALRDCPRVVLFFLEFLVRNRALPELKREIGNAIAIVRKAQEELPQTKTIGLNVPDEFALCCTKIFGSRVRKLDWSSFMPVEPENVKIEEVKEDAAEKNAFEKALDEENVLRVSAVDDLTPESPTLGESNSGGWGTGSWVDSAENTWGNSAAWGTISTDAPNITEAASGPIEGMTDNPWAQPVSTTGWIAPMHFLMTLMGPTSLPLSHKVGYVEESTRYVVSCTMPDTPSAGNPISNDLSMFAKVVFAPHKRFFRQERGAILRPVLLENPFKDREHNEINPDQPKHDPGKDEITVYLLPKAAETLIPKMSIGGTFVQVVPNCSWKESFSGDEGMGDLKPQQSGEVFWYIEKVVQILPSFWYERG